RFLHFHGQKTSRQDCYKSIYKDSRRKRTMLVRILSPVLFFFPDVHLLELEKVWTDKIVVEALWKEFMQKLVSEWTEFVLYSTVMLAANVAFLAIPGVIVAPQYPTPPDAWIKPSPAQIASSISLVFSIGSIITGLLLIRRNRTMMTKSPKSAWYYLHGMNWRVVGLEPLAIVFSLTYALLMWSYVFCPNVLDPLYNTHSFKQCLGVLYCSVDIQFPEHIDENLDSCWDRGWSYHNPHNLVRWEHLGPGRAGGRAHRFAV
ncbi:hypothetical protein BJY52DRAFT_1118855, partial [Lactarius psammicola]